MKDNMAKKKSEAITEISGFIGEGTAVEGEIHFKDAFRIDGKIKGKIVSDDMLIVGSKGDVEADIDVGFLSVSGTIRGTVRVREKLEIHPGGKIYGHIKMDKPNFVVEKGGIFEGKVDMNFKEKKG